MKRLYISLLFLFISVSHASAESGWQRLIPDYCRGQFAGSIGILSAGTGWVYGAKKQLDTDISFGYVPKNSVIDGFGVWTIKASYSPWDIPIVKSRFSAVPLTCGFFVSYAMSDEFWVKEPSKYNPPYYSFPTSVRCNLHLGQRLSYNMNYTRMKSISAYYELSICDFNIINAVSNSYLRPRDYLSLAFGVIMRFK